MTKIPKFNKCRVNEDHVFYLSTILSLTDELQEFRSVSMLAVKYQLSIYDLRTLISYFKYLHVDSEYSRKQKQDWVRIVTDKSVVHDIFKKRADPYSGTVTLYKHGTPLVKDKQTMGFPKWAILTDSCKNIFNSREIFMEDDVRPYNLFIKHR